MTTITLSRPLKTSAGEVATLTMREPLVEDHLAAEDLAPSSSNARVELTLFAMLVGHAPDDLGKLPMKDYKKVQDAYRGFTS